MPLGSVLLLALLVGSTSLSASPLGHLVLIGGGQKPREVLERFVDLAGGPEALILVVPTASELADTGDYYRQLFKEETGATNVTPLALSHRSQAQSQTTVGLVEKAGGIFFAGGDQRRITEVLRGTPVGDAIALAYARGAVVGGTSAGTACMSPLMITGDGDFDVISRTAVELWEGLNLFPDAILDQHFVARSRHNRLLSVVLEHPDLLGVGVDEATAVWLKPDKTFEVLGNGWVVVYDARKAEIGEREQSQQRHLGVVGLETHILLAGDRYDLRTRQALPLRVEVPASGRQP